MNQQAIGDIRRKLKVIEYAAEIGNVSKACWYYDVSREAFYQWKRAYETQGEAGHINGKPRPENPKIRLAAPLEEKIIYPP